jgi:hypothetical protein
VLSSRSRSFEKKWPYFTYPIDRCSRTISSWDPGRWKVTGRGDMHCGTRQAQAANATRMSCNVEPLTSARYQRHVSPATRLSRSVGVKEMDMICHGPCLCIGQVAESNRQPCGPSHASTCIGHSTCLHTSLERVTCLDSLTDRHTHCRQQGPSRGI